MVKKRTDNSHLQDKIKLREKWVNDGDTILDCFGGTGKVWNEIKKLKKNLTIISIDKKSYKNVTFKGDNLKYLERLLPVADIIDFDSYGMPYKQLEIIKNNQSKLKYNCRIFITFIQIKFGGLPNKMLEQLGYSLKMIEKIPALFYRNEFEKLCGYLKNELKIRGVYYIMYKTLGKKYYIGINDIKRGERNGIHNEKKSVI